ncbi:hypothetical protein ASG31_14905 [Chryseobacterium sp. Leaf404]|uniref:hypothetical protein n=1 Tax=unclassified Chryseobacterium TaxID=2593645 RepID=UPI0006F372F6|nr:MULTISPECIES: hypothetical protein [unclassified Chryseobacterium]KQT15547.1 hypothetical protein ASG31_14905 [Chryseobacterium sp. Leaf404]
MKKNIFTVFMLLFGLLVSAQSTYEKTVQEKAKSISAAKTATDYDKLFNEFSVLTRSKDSYKWKAYYYAGYAMYKKTELNLSKNPSSDERNNNGIAEKYAAGALAFKQDDKESKDLLNLIMEQRSKMEKKTATN